MGHVWNFEKCPNNFVTGTRTPGSITKTRFPDNSQRKSFIPKFPDEKKGKRERTKNKNKGEIIIEKKRDKKRENIFPESTVLLEYCEQYFEFALI